MLLSILVSWALALTCPNGVDHTPSACTFDGGTLKLTCDATVNGDTGAATVRAVYNATTVVCDEEYCIWGTDASGTAFCYEWDAPLDLGTSITLITGS